MDAPWGSGEDRELTENLTRLSTGQRVPEIELPSGESLVQILQPGKRTVILMTSLTCGPCRMFEAGISTWLNSVNEALGFLRVQVAPPEGMDIDTSEIEGLATHQISPEDFTLFLSPTPGALLVDSTGTLLAPAVAGAEEIEGLIRLALAAKD